MVIISMITVRGGGEATSTIAKLGSADPIGSAAFSEGAGTSRLGFNASHSRTIFSSGTTTASGSTSRG
ncbi:hypothetical protein AMTR_s00047p00146530 [Amborella trichopoda]|uniref:Uncharacterized protein n=1 Tax=Amborella trichopoda TaxID=13333 RepID=U5D6B5_AMBTC|nr:hypothetical protein AMTR_s00047p00146530 [Amborella trichopoda]